MKFIIKHLSKSYENDLVLKDIDFTFESGKIYGLLGRNGAGKTTLFNCINRDIKRDSGELSMEVDGVERPLTPEDIGYVLSTPTVPEFLTGREFLKFFMDIHKDKIGDMKTQDEYFDYKKVAYADRDKLLKDYSHGMKNKMQMLINIIAEPNILLLDEPLTSLDVVVAEEMKELLKSIKGGRITIFSTHILDLALDLCDEIVLLAGGVLETVDKANLDNDEFRKKIIQALKDDDPDIRPAYDMNAEYVSTADVPEGARKQPEAEEGTDA
ncbi:MAG: ABC transporter ATP-binding protein [Firmicutes bacterium]|nr:ABC transporter ATP-binding protein [Bacillota bacterium]